MSAGAEKNIGTLEVLILRGENLDNSGASFGDRLIDPYVKILPKWLTEKGGKVRKKDADWKSTKWVEDGGVNPKWEEAVHGSRLSFPVTNQVTGNRANAMLNIECYDHDMMCDDLIGKASISIYKCVTDAKSREMDVPVGLELIKKKKTKQAGTLHVTVKYVPAPPAKSSAAKKAALKKKKTKKQRQKQDKKTGAKKGDPSQASEEAEEKAVALSEAFKILRKELLGVDVKDLFTRMDPDGNGAITTVEFKQALLDMDLVPDKLTGEQVDCIVEHFDMVDGTTGEAVADGNILYVEFEATMSRKVSPGSPLDNILKELAEMYALQGEALFRMFDTDDGDGNVSYAEFDKTIRFHTEGDHGCSNISEGDMQTLRRHFDADQDGSINIQEFKRAVTSQLKDSSAAETIGGGGAAAAAAAAGSANIDSDGIQAAMRAIERPMPMLRPGKLEIRVKRGDLIRDTSNIADKKMDPYVRLRPGWKKAFSKTKDARNMHKYPVWTEDLKNAHSFDYAPPDIDAKGTLPKDVELILDVWDDQYVRDSLIGKGSFDLSRLISEEGSAQWREYKISIMHKERVSGDIFLDMRFVTKASRRSQDAKRAEAKMAARQANVAGFGDKKTKKNAAIGSDVTSASGSLDNESKDDELGDGGTAVPPGMVGVLVKSAKDLYDVEWALQKMDPYVMMIPSWLDKTMSHRTATKVDGDKSLAWTKKDASFAHFPVTEVSSEEDLTSNEEYTVRVEVVDDNTLNDKLIGFAVVPVRPYIDRVAAALHTARAEAARKGEPTEMVKIEPEPLEDIIVKLTREKGKPAGTIVLGVKFSHIAGAPASSTTGNTNLVEVSTGDMSGASSTAGSLTITVGEAMNLKDEDWIGKSDPFVQILLEPKAPKAAKTCAILECAQTRIKNGAGRNAVFNETFTMPFFRFGSGPQHSRRKGSDRLKNRTLRINVRDKDPRILGIGSDDLLGTTIQDLAICLATPGKPLSATLHLQSSSAGKMTKSSVEIATTFTPANPKANMKSMLSKTGRIQIFVMEGTGLRSVEGFGGGEQDPMAWFRIVDNEDSVEDEQIPAWRRTRYVNGGGKNPIFADWIEVLWTEEHLESIRKGVKKRQKKSVQNEENDARTALTASGMKLHCALYDDNSPFRSKKLIGAGLISLIDALEKPEGVSMTLGPDFAPSTNAQDDSKSVGKIRFAAQFIPNEDKPEVQPLTSVKQGTLKLHVIGLAGGSFQGASKNVDSASPEFALVASVRTSADDSSIDKKHNPAANTDFTTLDTSSDTGVPFIWNQVIDLPWGATGSAAKSTSPTLHLEILSKKNGKPALKGDLSGKLVLPFGTVASFTQNISGPSWLPLQTEEGSKWPLGEGARINIAWQFIADADPSASQAKEDFNTRPTDGSALNFSAPVVKPGKLFVRVLEAKNLKDPQWFGTCDPFPEARLLPGGESDRMHACEDGGTNPHWDWGTSPAWSFLVEDASVASLEVSIFNEKSWVAKKMFGGLMGAVSLSLSSDVLSRAKPKEPTKKWYQVNPPGKEASKSTSPPMVLVETWFEPDGTGEEAIGWAPSMGNERPIPFFPKPEDLDTNGVLHIMPLRAFDLRNVETWGGVQDPFLKVIMLCGNDDKPANEKTTKVQFDKGTHAVWKDTIVSLEYTPNMGDHATAAGSTPYICVEMWDKNKISANKLIGRVEIPLLPFLRNEGSVYSRTLSLMDENQVGLRGKLEAKLQFISAAAATAAENGPFHFEAPAAPEPRGGQITLTVSKARNLISDQMFGDQDPFVRVRLTRGGFKAIESTPTKEKLAPSSNEQGEDPVARPRTSVSLNLSEQTKHIGSASHSTRVDVDGGTDPVWDEPPFSLITHDAEFDMLRLEIVNDDPKNKCIIGNFELPLLEVLDLLRPSDNSDALNGNATQKDNSEPEAHYEIKSGDDQSGGESKTASPPSLLVAAPKESSDVPIPVAEGWYPVFRANKNEPEKRGEIRLQMLFESIEQLESEAEEEIIYGPVRFLGGDGFLHIRIISARGLRVKRKKLLASVKLFPKDAPGPTRPSQHGWSQQTQVDDGSGKNTDPVWNQSFVAPIKWKPGDEKPPFLEFSVKEKGGGTRGTSTLDVAPFIMFPGQPVSCYLPLGKDGADGELLVHVQFTHLPTQSGGTLKKPKSPFPRSIMRSISECSHKGDIDLTINKARNLRVVQFSAFGKQDPYVKVKIRGGSLGSKGITAETRQKKNGGTNAVWKEQLQVAFNDTILAPGTGSTPLLEYQVFDKNTGTLRPDSKIGTCIVPMFPFQMNDGHTGENWFPLRTGKGNACQSAGELHVASQWLPEGALPGARGPVLSGDRPLYVHVLSARGLPQVTSIEKQDPYVRLSIVGQDVTVSTPSADDQGTTPQWNSYFPIPLTDDISGSPTVHIEVKHKGGVMGDTFIAQCQFQLPSHVLKPPFERLDLKDYALRDKNNKEQTGSIWIQVQRQPFEGMEGRDDGLGRGEGQTTLLQEEGADEDDDGEIDGRLHVELMSVTNVPQLEGRDLRNRGLKLRLQLDPPGKSRQTRVVSCSDKLPSSGNNLDFVFRGAMSDGSFDNSVVLPFAINEDGRGAVEAGEALLTIWLVEPSKGMFGKEIVVASGQVKSNVLTSLVVKADKPVRQSATVQVPLSSGNYDMGGTVVNCKLQYVPALSGRVRAIVKQAQDLANVSIAGLQDPICKLILGSERTTTTEATDQGQNPKWKGGEQRFLRYTNANQHAPSELKVQLWNNGIGGRSIGTVNIPILPLIANAGNEQTRWYDLKTMKGKDGAGKIEIALLFIRDHLNDEQATAEEIVMEDRVDDALRKGDTPELSEDELKMLKKKQGRAKERLDAGARLKLLKDLFKVIDKDGSGQASRNELAEMLKLATENENLNILREYLLEKFELTGEDAGERLTADLILEGIDENDDDMVSWAEWIAFIGNGRLLDRTSSSDSPGDLLNTSGGRMKKANDDGKKIDGLTDMNDENRKARDAALEAEKVRKAQALADDKQKALEYERRQRERAAQHELMLAENERLRLLNEQNAQAAAARRAQDARDAKDRDAQAKLRELEIRKKLAEEARLRDAERRRQADAEKKRKARKARKKRKALQEKRVPRPPDNMVAHWRPYHVTEWLTDVIELPQYCDPFESSSVDGLLLVSLTDKDLKKVLGIKRRLHRAKIAVHVRRLAQLSGLEQSSATMDGHQNTRPRKSSSEKGGTRVQWGDNGGAANPAAPELLRMQMEKIAKKRKKIMAKQDKEDAVHGGYWAFEYDNPRNAEVVTQADAWDFDDDWADQFNDDGAFEHGRDDVDDEYERPADEEAFRQTMKNVWAKDAQRAQQAGMSNDALNAFGSGAGNAAYDAVDDPFNLVKKFAEENEMSFFQALQTPEIKRLRLRLKTGHSVYSAAPEAITCRQLPPEYWFKSQAPWWMTLKAGDGKAGNDLHQKGVKPRKIPYHATTEEVLTCVRQAVLEYGRYLHFQKKHELDPESLQMDLEEKHKRIAEMRTRQGLPSLEPLSMEEDRLLSDAFHAMSRMQNNTTIINGKSASWTGTHDKLNRLKFQGAVKVLLKLAMTWQQFDAVFRAISTNADGNIQEDEFVAAFRSSAKLADLLKRDTAGEVSRQGGRRRRLLKSEGFHGSGAKAGDDNAQQIHDALDAILETLEETGINLREAFESFDRNASGSISTAEFTSLIKTIGGVGLTKRQCYHLAASMDSDFTRSVEYNEFMEFFLVVWVERLRGLRRQAARPDKSLPEAVAKKRMIVAKRRLRKAERAIKITFGSGFAAAAANAGAVLPGAFSALTRKMNMETTAIQATFTPMSPTGRVRVDRARNAVVTGTAMPPTSPLRNQQDAGEEDTESSWGRGPGAHPGRPKPPSDLIREGRVQPVGPDAIAGRHALKRFTLRKTSKRMRGEVTGPVVRDYGKAGPRESGVPPKKNAFSSFPEGFVPAATL
jgi:Ca2+-binding EF-hand superfamily protein